MISKNAVLDSAKELLDNLDNDVSEITENVYKNQVAVDTLLSLLIKKDVFDKDEFSEEMARIRKKIKGS